MLFVVTKLFFTQLELSAKTMCISREVSILTPLRSVCRTHQKWMCFVTIKEGLCPHFLCRTCQCKHNIPKHARNLVVTPVMTGLLWLLTLSAGQITSKLSLQGQKVSRWTTAQELERTRGLNTFAIMISRFYNTGLIYLGIHQRLCICTTYATIHGRETVPNFRCSPSSWCTYATAHLSGIPLLPKHAFKVWTRTALPSPLLFSAFLKMPCFLMRICPFYIDSY